ncbi:MAG: hypothetical protein JW860_00795 [Sedimentisphaerales bacterium]|nr:hypothetical protein [Sedimentisphaerales bacterium]
MVDNGNAIARYTQTAEEDGYQLHIVFWEIAHPLPPEHLRLAIFSYTILHSQKDKPCFVAEIQLIDECLQKAVFADVLGQ